MDGKLSFVILACGGRGEVFSKWIADHPSVGTVVAAADPDAAALRGIAESHGVPEHLRFSSWEELLSRPKLADVAINTTMDQFHYASATRALNLGYHMLLEKPMATTLEECVAIDQAARKNRRIVSVCHSMRYHTVYQRVKQLLRDGAIGQIVSFDQLEAVEPIHQSHSFVRGNWGNEARSSFMLLAKSCHDVDVLAWLVGRACRKVSSFGSLSYFRRECAPASSGERCTDCAVESNCMYSALKIYLETGSFWASHARITGTSAQRIELLKTSPYGRCVWKCDNDVVDHQVVSFEFEGGVTGTLTMTAFATEGRYLRVHGTEGWLRASVDGNAIDLVRFEDRSRTQIRLDPVHGSHGGADSKMMEHLVTVLRANDPTLLLTGTAESLDTHRIVFAAELARRSGRVISVGSLDASDG